MKKYAFLFGNTNGLPGVHRDLINFRNHLCSNFGGAWDASEVKIEQNLSLIDLEKKLNELSRNKYDYLIIYFSGHGGKIFNKDYISLNKNNETIEFCKLTGISKKQLTIFDCCRASDDKCVINDSKNFSRKENENRFRSFFEKRISEAREQQMILYSCKDNEFSNDTSEGGLYTFHFLKYAKNIQLLNKSELLVSECHELARKKVIEMSNKTQTPDYQMPRLSPENQLIISVNPKLYNYMDFF